MESTGQEERLRLVNIQNVLLGITPSCNTLLRFFIPAIIKELKALVGVMFFSC